MRICKVSGLLALILSLNIAVGSNGNVLVEGGILVSQQTLRPASARARSSQQPIDIQPQAGISFSAAIAGNDTIQAARGLVADSNLGRVRRLQRVPDLPDDLVELKDRILGSLDEKEMRILSQRLKLLGPKDIHGLVRYLKDIAFIAASRQLSHMPEIIDQIPAGLENASLINTDQNAILTEALKAGRQQVLERFMKGKAIVCYGIEVRLDPVKGIFQTRQSPRLSGYAQQPLVIRGPPKVVIGVPVFNGWEDVKLLLQSLAQVRTEADIELVILDNGSRESRLEELFEIPRRTPDAEYDTYDLTCIKSPLNLGYDEGNNVLIDRCLDANADFFITLNSDVTVKDDFLEPLLTLFEEGWAEGGIKAEEVGIAGPIVYEVPREGQNSKVLNYGAHFKRLFEKGTLSLKRLIKGRLPRYLGRPVIAKGARNAEGLPDIMSVDIVVGMAMAFPSYALRLVGGFDPRFFAYGEEDDVAIRFKNAGFKRLVTKKSAVTHKEHGSSRGSVLIFVPTQQLKNYGLILRKHAELWHPNLLARYLVSTALNIIKGLRRGINSSDMRYFTAPAKGLIAGIMGRFSDAQVQELYEIRQPGRAQDQQPQDVLASTPIIDELGQSLKQSSAGTEQMTYTDIGEPKTGLSLPAREIDERLRLFRQFSNQS